MGMDYNGLDDMIKNMSSNNKDGPKQIIFKKFDGVTEASCSINEKTGAIRPNLSNIVKILEVHPELRGRLKWDLLRSRASIMQAVPWSTQVQRPWTDHDDRKFAVWLQDHNVEVKLETVRHAVECVAHDNEYHPVRDYLNGLVWDKEPRIDYWLELCLGCDVGTPERKQFVWAVSRKFLIAAVARAMRPGCKVDTCLVLEGDQGKGKSKAIQSLFGSDHFSDDLADIGAGKAAAEALQGIWCLEFAELAALQKGAVVETIKAFMSRQTDRFRPAYGFRVQEYPRQCVFMASTNEEGYLRDATGARRWWPVRCGKIDIARLVEERDQLWAEAVVCYNSGERWWLLPDDEVVAKVEQDARFDEDVWTQTISEFLAGQDKVTTAEVLAHLGIPMERRDDRTSKRVGRVLRRLGCAHDYKWVTNKCVRAWRVPGQ